MRRRFTERATAPDGTPTKTGGAAYMRDNREVLARYPQLRQTLDNAVTSRNEATRRTDRAKSLNSAIDNPRLSATAGFVDTPANKAFDTILNARNPRAAAAQIFHTKISTIRVLDPACGTGGFLTSAIEYVRVNQVKTAKQRAKLQRQIYGVEKKPMPHLLCVTNMLLHGIDVPDQIRHDNTLSRPLQDYSSKDRVDVIITNPPFNDAGHRPSPSLRKEHAHMMGEDTLENWFRTAAAVLKPKGQFALIVRPSSLPRLLDACGARFGGISLMPVHPMAKSDANRILLVARRGSRAPMRILPGLTVHNEDGSFTGPANAIFEGTGNLSFG